MVAPDASNSMPVPTGTTTHRNDNYRLNMYLAFRDANTAKWLKVGHVIEPEPNGTHDQHHVDPED